MISVIFPTYNEEGNVKELHRLNKETLDAMGEPYEIIVVDNGSTDATLEILKTLHPVTIVVLPKNFGQTLALDAGIKAAKGEWVVIMDGDLQNDPRDIPAMMAKAREGYDVVAGWRRDRHDSFGRRFHSRMANWLTRKISGLNLHDHACALKVYRKSWLDGIHLAGVQHVFLAAQLFLRGARITEVEVTHHERKSGLSKHHLLAGVKAIADLLMVRVLAPRTRPMLFFSALGLGVAALAAASLALAVWLNMILPVLIGIFLILISLFPLLGIIAELLWRNYYDSRDLRPYQIKEIIRQ